MDSGSAGTGRTKSCKNVPFLNSRGSAADAASGKLSCNPGATPHADILSPSKGCQFGPGKPTKASLIDNSAAAPRLIGEKRLVVITLDTGALLEVVEAVRKIKTED
jgi:hypothetical protein